MEEEPKVLETSGRATESRGRKEGRTDGERQNAESASATASFQATVGILL